MTLPFKTSVSGWALSKIAKQNGLDGIFVVSIDGLDTRQYEPEGRKTEDSTVHYQSEVKVSAKLIDARTANIVWSASYENIQPEVNPLQDGTAISPSVTVLTRGITPMRTSSSNTAVATQKVSTGTSAEPRYDNAGYDLQTVKTVQTQLIAGGYSPGVADGLAGKKTTDALWQFQGDQGLKVTGALNDETISLLHTLYGGSTPDPITATPENVVAAEKPVDEPLSDVAVSATATASVSAKITRGPAEVYNKPSPFGRVLKTLSDGARIEVLGTTGEWVEIKLGQSVGYLYKDLTNLLD